MPDRDESSVHLDPPPRRVPMSSAATILLTGSFAGWAFFAFSAPFMWVFGFRTELNTYFSMIGERGHTRGELEGVRRTSMEENDRTIVAVTFRYQVDGRPYRAVSYTTDSYAHLRDGFQVEYLRRDPRVSRIEGLRRQPWSAWAVLVLLFPAIGLGMIVVNIRERIPRLRLLARGVLGRAERTDRSDHRGEGGARYDLVYTWTIAENSDDDVFRRPATPATERTLSVSTQSSVEADEEYAYVLYDPRGAPDSFAMLVRELAPVELRGQVQGAQPRWWLMPLVTAAVHLVSALFLTRL